jgi:hypothetical protein
VAGWSGPAVSGCPAGARCECPPPDLPPRPAPAAFLPARPAALGELKSKYPPCCLRLLLPCAGQQAVLEAVSRFVSTQPEGIAVDFDSDRATDVPSDSVELPDGRRRMV